MFQDFILDECIPSCELHGLLWRDDSWKFLYMVKTPLIITNENTMPLMIYEFISDLKVVKDLDQHEDSVNIRFKTLDEYMSLLSKQRQADLEFRRQWIAKNPDMAIQEFCKRKVKNGVDYDYSKLKEMNIHFVSGILEQDDLMTVFSGS